MSGSTPRTPQRTDDTVPEVRPRYGRIAVFAVSVLVTGTAVLGGTGVLPAGASYAAANEPDRSARRDTAAMAAAAERAGQETRDTTGEAAPDDADDAEDPEDTDAEPAPVAEPDPEDLEVPGDSGEGRRVVFDEGAQRVWLVKGDGSVERTYLVSGSIYDNLDPGTYQVYSRSKDAVGIDGSQMRYMVRFTAGAEAAIGFHDLPRVDGERVQTRDELGVPLSHGCIRQWRPDAKALWDFAPLGTTVVVIDTSPDDEDQSEDVPAV